MRTKEITLTSESRKTVKTGRELDAEVAERVMCLRVTYSLKLGGDWTGENIEQGYARVLPYSTSIEAAMQVVEKMRERGVWTQIQIFTHTTQVRVEMGVPSSECQEWGDTAAEAICKCALKALEKFNPSAALSAVDSQG